MSPKTNTFEPVRKEWRKPELRKLPIAATSQGKPTVGHNDGNENKNGSSGSNS